MATVPLEVSLDQVSLLDVHEEASGSLTVSRGCQTPLKLPTATPESKELVVLGSSFCDIVSSTEKSVQVELEF